MPQRMINRLLSGLGLRLHRLADAAPPNAQRAPVSVLLHRYLRPDGSFDYESYRRIQIAGNKRKIDVVWVREENVAFLAAYIRSTIGSPRFGICHGTRRGNEQAWFRKHLGCDVLGTEISDTALEFPHTIQWDFHEVKPEWIEAVDFIYSNSFDHSYDPERCLRAWMSCVRPGGLCVLEHSNLHGPEAVNELDPFGADIGVLPYLIVRWGAGEFAVRELLDAPSKHKKLRHLTFVVIQRFPRGPAREPSAVGGA